MLAVPWMPRADSFPFPKCWTLGVGLRALLWSVALPWLFPEVAHVAPVLGIIEIGRKEGKAAFCLFWFDRDLGSGSLVVLVLVVLEVVAVLLVVAVPLELEESDLAWHTTWVSIRECPVVSQLR